MNSINFIKTPPFFGFPQDINGNSNPDNPSQEYLDVYYQHCNPNNSCYLLVDKPANHIVILNNSFYTLEMGTVSEDLPHDPCVILHEDQKFPCTVQVISKYNYGHLIAKVDGDYQTTMLLPGENLVTLEKGHIVCRSISEGVSYGYADILSTAITLNEYNMPIFNISLYSNGISDSDLKIQFVATPDNILANVSVVYKSGNDIQVDLDKNFDSKLLDNVSSDLREFIKSCSIYPQSNWTVPGKKIVYKKYINSSGIAINGNTLLYITKCPYVYDTVFSY